MVGSSGKKTAMHVTYFAVPWDLFLIDAGIWYGIWKNIILALFNWPQNRHVRFWTEDLRSEEYIGQKRLAG